MHARLYDPILGRFLAPDSLVQDPNNGQTYNRYGYANNSPLLYTDPTGHFFEDWSCCFSPEYTFNLNNYSPPGFFSFNDTGIPLTSGVLGNGAFTPGFGYLFNTLGNLPGANNRGSSSDQFVVGCNGPCSYEQIARLVRANNLSGQSDELIIAMAWKESSRRICSRQKQHLE